MRGTFCVLTCGTIKTLLFRYFFYETISGNPNVTAVADGGGGADEEE